MSTKTSIHQFTVQGLNGSTIQFKDYAGKRIVLVNTASACGFTPQYKGLQELFVNNADKLVVVGVPCNDFGKQEPGSTEEIQSFCQLNFGVSFPMTAKMNITSTPVAPLYNWLCSAQQNGVKDCEVKWNFHKFLLDEKGHLVTDFPSSVLPEEILATI